jgi:N-acetylmuramoyl-L-alanine amidase
VIGVLYAALALWPQQLTITTPRGEAAIPVTMERGIAAIAASRLAAPLRLGWTTEAGSAQVQLAGAVFRFTLGSPFARADTVVCSLYGAPYLSRDTLFLPLEWLTDCVPRVVDGRFRWIAADSRFVETATLAAAPPMPQPATAPPLPPAAPAPAPAAPSVRAAAAAAPNAITGLRRRHTVMVDPGHGGVDPGNPGLYLPSGLVEKDINLAVGRLLRAELQRRGLDARLTRTTDTLIALDDRGPMCGSDCDLFVSVHVNAMPAGRRQKQVNGVETYFLSDAKTEDQRRVATMENDAIRFESTTMTGASGDLGFILRDLQQNEYLRESARLAELVQRKLAVTHPGEDRGVQQAALRVLSTAQRPAVLVEVGFATHKEDGAFLGSALGQRRIANAIADGVVAYLLEYERKLAISAGGQ